MTPDTTEPAVMTLREVAALLRIHPASMYQLLRDRRIPAFKIGSDWRFNREQIDKWRLSQTGVTGGSKGAARGR
jgi:excisionase family DNA binding protein